MSKPESIVLVLDKELCCLFKSLRFLPCFISPCLSTCLLRCLFDWSLLFPPIVYFITFLSANTTCTKGVHDTLSRLFCSVLFHAMSMPQCSFITSSSPSRHERTCPVCSKYQPVSFSHWCSTLLWKFYLCSRRAL